MKEIVKTKNVHKIPIDFILYPNKQRILVEILLRYSRLKLNELATVLTLPLNHLLKVLKGEAYFDKNETQKLVQYFCIFCGE